MKEFFEKLKTEEELDVDDIKLIADIFATQKIKFRNLMAQGELGLTDGKLKEVGISQLGLRTSILELVKKYQTI